MLSSPWALENASTYVRPLGPTEEIFYWDGLFEGTADATTTAEIEILHGSRESIISQANVEAAWISLKLKYPLLGSRIIRRPDQSLWFSVDSDRLSSAGPGELLFHEVASDEEALVISSSSLKHPRILSTDLLACAFILRRTDDRTRFHIAIHIAHSISDGNANSALCRFFFDCLASGSSYKYNIEGIRDRLALASSCDDLNPVNRLSVPRKRWRNAVGAIIWENRLLRLRGGHTLPCKVTNTTAYQPAGSGHINIAFTQEETQGILQGCRQIGLTFGTIFTVIEQVALTRILCKKYLHGEMSQDEWEFRKREPMITGGPLNLRPYLDKEWFNKGGATNASLAIGFFIYQLPFMPLGAATNVRPRDPLPSYDDLLSKKRFTYRCTLVKREADLVLRNPLQHEISSARFPGRIAIGKDIAETWKYKMLFQSPADRRMLSPQELAENGMVSSYGGSSFGSSDQLYPEFYPLSGERHTLRLVRSVVGLHTRPRELYLGATTVRGQLRMYIYYDTNVYDEDLVKQWLDEVKDATFHYLLPKKYNSSHL
ncbi:hypothetical protein AGABI1DRAFT_118066 [Agaricus bisporus var. burnettii JB137-S8]|uniref:Condensation domain-containing protein n=1 Tax=Agaricus bisporus var. burnettii (strain JB137-S8 / ATCC MYA-4627 / FGSC 10392) TaxID=597362 RepID=K5W728_AGABU|nr:uncharacterized protein AGABI1DRAFT_118066 [Agaricus bisporus var. burnettii JB137-S8]EKM82619.1 hypothetical protein AGABI1DRAFT_118066 [Agaricus bisporus var. burnettii JB137-S8]